ncbi:MAG: protein jag [Firmicutes bacterium]|nr:protein jag [Bacillota bacterium]
MKSVEKRGKSVEEAVALALLELGAKREDVEVEVLEEGSKGFLGLLGSREARVRVAKREDRGDFARNYVTQLCELMSLPVKVEVADREGVLYVNVAGDEVGALIGRRGQGLDAVQYLLNLSAARIQEDKRRVVLDVEGYRDRREKTLKRLATNLAEKVRRTGRSVALEPMSSQERRVVHMALQDNPFVVTRSEGAEPYRKIVISVRR